MYHYRIIATLLCISMTLFTSCKEKPATVTLGEKTENSQNVTGSQDSALQVKSSILSEVKKEIRTDGTNLSMQETEGFNQLNKLKLILEELNSPYLKEYSDVMAVLTTLQAGIGLQDIDGYGCSVAQNKELYDFDFFAHMKPGNEKSILWKVMGGEAAKLKGFDLLPDNTILAISVRLDLKGVYDFIKMTLPLVKVDSIEEVKREILQLEEEAARNEMPISKFVEAFSTEATTFLTINKNATMKLPDAPELPQMAFGIIIEQKSDFLASLLRKNVETQFKPVTIADFHTVNPNEKFPTGTTGGYAFSKEIGILSSDFEVIKKVIDIKNGKRLVDSEKFAKFKNVSRIGNFAFYLSPEVSETISTVVKDLPPEQRFVEPLINQAFFKVKTPEFFGVISKKANGLKIDSLSNFSFPGNILSNFLLILGPGMAVMSEVENKMRYERRYR